MIIQRKKRMTPITRWSILFVTVAFFVVVLTLIYEMSKTKSFDAANQSVQIPVLAIGGSVAHGWKDTTGPGYLARAFLELSSHSNTSYHYIDRTIVGANGVQLATLYKNHYLEWLHAFAPKVVIISWGLLNDALPKTPISTFDFHIRQEIAEALSVHAVVLMVTPPVTKASYTQFKVQEPRYVLHEIQVAKSFNSPNVVVCDVYDQMRSYIVAHKQSYKMYMGDGWHPNSAGHILAGHLLYKDIIAHYGNKAISYVG